MGVERVYWYHWIVNAMGYIFWKYAKKTSVNNFTGWARKIWSDKYLILAKAISVIEILKNWEFLFVFLCQFSMSRETFGWISYNGFLKHYLSQKRPHLLSQNTYTRQLVWEKNGTANNWTIDYDIDMLLYCHFNSLFLVWGMHYKKFSRKSLETLRIDIKRQRETLSFLIFQWH